MALSVVYTPEKRIIAAALRFREAWGPGLCDMAEMHEAALGLIWATGTKDLQSALDVLHDVGC